MKTAPPRIGNLTLDAALTSDEAIDLIKAEDLADPYGDLTQEALAHLGGFSHVALLTFPSTPEQPVPDRVLFPLNPTGYGPACFLRALEYGGYRLGRPRPLNDGTASAIAAAATDLLGWPRFAPPTPHKPAPPRRKKKVNPEDRTRRDLPIYLDLLTEVGEAVPSEAEMAATPICDLLRELHARVIEKNPLHLIALAAGGKKGALTKHVKDPRFARFFTCVKVRWVDGQAKDNGDGSDNSAYRQLLGDIYNCLVKAKGGKSNWLKLFNPGKCGVVAWIDHKVKVVALPQLNDRDTKGSRILTPDHESYDAFAAAQSDCGEFLSNPVLDNATSAFGPAAFDPTKADPGAGIAAIRYCLGRMSEMRRPKRREAFNAIDDLIEDYQLDSDIMAELEPELVAARERFLGIAAVPEGSASIEPNPAANLRDHLRAVKTKVAASRAAFAACDFSTDAPDPYAVPVPEEVIAAKSAEFWERMGKKTAEFWEQTRQTLLEARPKRRQRKADPDQFLLFPDASEPAASEAPKARPVAQAAVEPPKAAPKPASARRRKEPDPNQMDLPLVMVSEPAPKARPEPAAPIPVGTLEAFFNPQSVRLTPRGSPAVVSLPRIRGPNPARSRPRAKVLV